MKNGLKIPADTRLTRWFLGMSLLLAVCLLSHCKPPSGTSAPASHVEVEISWPDCSAEVLRDVLSQTSIQCTLAVIDDGRAKMYFTQPLSEAESLLKSNRENLPTDLTAKPPVLVPGAIPAPPVPARETRLVFEADAGKLAAFGVSLAQLNAHLAIPHDRDISPSSFTTPDGRMIPYADLGEFRQIEVMRPLIAP